MGRNALIRGSDGIEQVVPQSPLPSEAVLHDALTSHPQLLPAGDLGLGRAVVAGRESGVVAGYADLVPMDEQGQVCVVEVKKEGNPDTRRVVAQLLDYAAELWGMTLEEFEQASRRRAPSRPPAGGPRPGRPHRARGLLAPFAEEQAAARSRLLDSVEEAGATVK